MPKMFRNLLRVSVNSKMKPMIPHSYLLRKYSSVQAIRHHPKVFFIFDGALY